MNFFILKSTLLYYFYHQVITNDLEWRNFDLFFI